MAEETRAELIERLSQRKREGWIHIEADDLRCKIAEAFDAGVASHAPRQSEPEQEELRLARVFIDSARPHFQDMEATRCKECSALLQAYDFRKR